MDTIPAPDDTSRPVPVELLLEPEWLIPIDPAGITLTDHALAIDGGRIVALLPRAEARRRFLPGTRLALPGQAVLPGFINLHTHAAMSLLRGYADDLPLMRWLQERIWPAEGRHANADFVADGTLLACAEMLRGGITCFNDMYFFPEAAARSVRRAGMRAALGMVVIEFPTAYAPDADGYIARGAAFRDSVRDDPLISCCWAPHGPYTVSDRSFERIATLAAQTDLPIHLHVHETEGEIAESVRQHGVRPLHRLHRLGIVGPQLIAVHAVHLTPTELDLLAAQGASVAHCPTSNLKLASGLAPVAGMAVRGIPVGLGTDGAASNNRLDLFHELRHAALLAKGSSGDASVFGAHAALRAATLDGARALGLDHEIGSLAPGKCADLVAVRLDDWLTGPCYDPASHLVYVAGREQVTHVWVAGKQQVAEGRLTGLPDQALIEIVRLWHNLISS